MADEQNQTADDPKAAAKAAAKSERDASAERGATELSRERLLADSSDLIGHPPHVLAGALYGDDRESLSLDDAKAAVNDYLSREIPV